MTTAVQALLSAGIRQLAAAHHLSPREATLEARLLLAHVLNVPPLWLTVHGQETVGMPQLEAWQALLARRLQGEPIAYLLGEWEFYGLSLAVNPDVLVPRPDTETLVELALARLPAQAASRVLDLGTGSGAIAIAIAVHRPQARVTAIDRMPAALITAAANGERHAPGRIRFLAGSWYAPVSTEQFDLIVANPPYIREDDPHLCGDGIRFEPISALTAGGDGLNDLRQIIAAAPQHLLPGGSLLVEHGYEQQAAVMALMRAAGLTAVSGHADLTGQPRVVAGRRPALDEATPET